MARKQTSPKSESNATLRTHSLPTWALPGIVLLGSKKIPMEKGYTHAAASRYANGCSAERLKEIERHLERDLNLGWCPPHNMIAIDADNAAATEWLDAVMPATCPQQRRTQDKGHWFVRVDDSFPVYTRAGLRLDVGASDPARVDVRTWGNIDEDLPGGGYVVIPPSKHESGTHYRWAVELPDDPEDVPMIPAPVVETLAPNFQRSVNARSPRAAGSEIPRHDLILSYCARAVRYESRTNPEESIARVIAKGAAYAEELYGEHEKERLAHEVENLERNVISAWDQWGGDAALDEQNLDRSIARIISSSFGDPWIYGAELNQWYEWDSVIWRPVHSLLVEQIVGRFPDTLLEDALRERDGERKKRLTAMAFSLSNAKKVSSVVATLRREFTRSIKCFDVNADLMTFPASEELSAKAYTINVRTGEMHEPRSEDMITRVAGACYVKDAKHEVVDRYFETSFPNAETRASVQELIGMLLVGGEQERMVSLHGTQGSGKGTLGFSLVYMLGDYAHTMGGAVLSGNGGFDGASKDFSLQYLRGKKMVYIDEFSGTLGEKAKTLTQAGQMTASVKYGEDFTFNMTHQVWISTNRRPKINDPQGFTRRLIEVPMNAGAEDIHNLDATVKRTLMHDPLARAALLNIALQALDRVRANQFQVTLSPEIKAVSGEWLQEANKLGEWIAGGCEVTRNPDDRIGDAFSVYIAWMDDQHMDRRDFPRANKNEFASLMRSMGFEPYRTNKERGYCGLKVKGSESVKRGQIVKLGGFKKKTE